MKNRIVTAVFKDSAYTKSDNAWQWDYGQILRIQGLKLPTAVEVHFAVSGVSESITRIGTTKDGVTDVVIPDSLIETGKNLVAYVYLRDSESGNTEYQIDIVVSKRAKPEAYNTPDDPELFGKAIEAVNKAADRAEKAGQDAVEAAGQAAEDAQQTAEDREEVAKMVETVSDISEQVKKVEKLSNKAQESATQAGTSATAAEKAKAQTETAAGKTAEDRTAVNQAKITVDEVQKAVRADRAAVEEVKQSVEQLSNAIPESTQAGVQAVNQAKQTAVDEIARTGISHKTAVEGAGTQAVESVENAQQAATEAVGAAKTTAVQAVQSEGVKQTGNVTAEGTKQVKAVQDKGNEVLQSIPEDFTTQMETKLDKQQGIENKGKALVIGEDGNVVPGEVASGGGDGIAIINTMSGESPLVIPDSAERVNKGLELGGKTEQVQTTGKNLFNTKTYRDMNGCEIINNNQLSFVQNLAKINYEIELDAGDYRISFNRKKYSSITIRNGETVLNTNGGESDYGYTIKLSEPAVISIEFASGQNPNAEQRIIYNIQLEKGTTATPYEPYTGGKPSPSPEYPQEIKSVGKWNEKTRKYEVEISISGRNLFDFSTCEEGKVFEGSGNIISATNGVLTDFIPCFPNSQYSRRTAGSTVIAFYDCDKNKIGFEIVGNTTFVTPEKCRYFRFSALKTVVDYTKIVACPGQTVMDYEPYREPKFFTLTSDRPITKWDRLVEQGGQIGWLYGTEKYVVTGKENFSYGSENYYTGSRVDMFFEIGDATGNEAIMRDLSFVPSIWHLTDKEGFCINGKQLHIGLYNTRIGVSDGAAKEEKIKAYKEFMAKRYADGNPFEVYYKTTETEFIPLPQSEQNAIRALKTYYPTTVITADGGELYPDIKVTYTADTKNYIDGKVSANVASIISQYQLNTANLLSLMPMETQAAMIENDTNRILENVEEMKYE